MPDDRDTSVTDDDLAIVTAKQKLVRLHEAPGYLEAMRQVRGSRLIRLIPLGAAAACGGLVYACKLYVTAGWLMWLLIVLFGLLALGFVLATIGMAPSITAGQRFGAAVVDKRIAGDKHFVGLLRESGERSDATVDEQMYGLLRPGDVGVVHTINNGDDTRVESFQRL